MRTLALLLSPIVVTALLPAQKQFADLARMELPILAVKSNDVAAGDLDGDGDQDLAFANSGQNTIYINDGDGHFTDETTMRMPARTGNSRAVVLADIDGDNDLDLLFGNNRQNRLYVNNGSGVFTVRPLQPTGTTYSNWNEGLAVGDVDGDNDLDVYLAEQGRGAAMSQNRLWLNDGAGNFTDVTATQLPAFTDASDKAAMGDVDNDGDLDIFVVNAVLLGQDRLYINNGSGTFADATVRLPQVRSNTHDVLLVDLDNDNDLEILTVGDNGLVFLLRNDGSLVFTDVSTGFATTGGTYSSAAAGDLDADGDIDLILGEESSATNRPHLNNGSLSFALSAPSRSSTDADNTNKIIMVDVDGDQDLDTVCANDASQSGQNNRLNFNLHRQIHTPMVPVIGQNYQIDFYAQSGFITSNQLMVTWIGFVRAVPPFQFPHWGAFHIIPQAAQEIPVLTVTPPTGLFTLNLPIVNAPSLINLPVFIQAGVVHTPDPLTWRFTNVVADRIQ